MRTVWNVKKSKTSQVVHCFSTGNIWSLGYYYYFFHSLHQKYRFYLLYSEDSWARLGTDCTSQGRLCYFWHKKTLGCVVLHSCPWGHIHSHLTEEERGTNGSDRCLWAVVLYKKNQKTSTSHVCWILKTSNSQLKSDEVESLDIFSKPKVTYSWTRK